MALGIIPGLLPAKATGDEDKVGELCRTMSEVHAETQQGVAELSTNGRWQIVSGSDPYSIMGATHVQDVVDSSLGVLAKARESA